MSLSLSGHALSRERRNHNDLEGDGAPVYRDRMWAVNGAGRLKD